MSGMNIFVVMKGKLVTPSLENTILDGVTRRCLIRLAEGMGFSIEERALSRIETVEHKRGIQIFDPYFPYAKSIFDKLGIDPDEYPLKRDD